MAEGTTTYSGQRVDELLRCPVCLDRFNQPKILPCQHTFCRTPCLQGLVDMQSRRLKCPECRAEHSVPYSGADGFPNNLIISNFLDLQPQAASAATPAVASGSSDSCAICEKSAETSKCGHCDKHLCAKCCKSHYTQLKFDVGRLVNQIRKGIPKLSESIADVEQKGEQVKQHVESVKSEVRDAIARYVHQLKDREKMLNSELDTFLQGELRNLRLKQENIEVELASISSYCDSTESLLNRSGAEIPVTELTTIKGQCVEYKDQIRDADASTSLETKLVSFESDGQNLIAGITNLGTLVVTTPGQTTSRRNRAPANNNRSTTNQSSPVRRSRWSSPQPLHELYTRDVNTPPPPATPPTSRSRSTPNAAPTAPGASRHIQTRNISSWNNTPRNPTINTSPFQNNPASTNFYNRMNNITQRAANVVNAGQYMFRMDPTGDRNPFLDQPRTSPGSVLSIGTNVSPRRATPSSMFGTYSPGRIPEERAIGIIPGLNRPDVPEDEEETRGTGASFNAGSTGFSTSASVDTPARVYDNRPAVAFSVDLEGESSSTTRRRGRRPPRLNRGRNGTRGGRRNTGSTSNSTEIPEEPAATVQPNTHRVRGPQRSEEPQPSTSSAPEEDSPVVPMYRSRTFVLDGSNNTTDNSNNNNSNPSSENVPSTSNEVPPEPTPSTSDGNDLIDWHDESLTVASSRNKYEKKSRVNKIIGSSRGNQPGTFTWPRGVAVSPGNKHIVVADSSNHRVQIFDAAGKFIKEFGAFGTAAGEFDCLAGVTCTDSGDVVIADRYNHRVQVFNKDGILQRVFGREGIGNGELSYPWGIALDGKKNVYVVDKENHRVQVFTWEGIFLRSISGFGEMPGRLKHPSYVAVSPDNRVIVSDTDNNRIQIFSSTGQHVAAFGTAGSGKGQLSNPKGIAVDSQGFILVADSGNSRVQVFRGNGQHFCMFGSYGRAKGQFKGLEGLALTPDGNIVISDKETHKVQVF